MNDDLEVVWEAGAELGEGPVWHDGGLWWVDSHGPAIFRHCPDSDSRERYSLPGIVGSVCPRAEGGLIVAQMGGFGFLDTVTGQLDRGSFADGEFGIGRLNDGKCDPAGRFWAGEISRNRETPDGRLFRVDRSQRILSMLDGIGTSNGLAWSGDGSCMFYIDSPRRRIDAFDFDVDTGEIANRRTVVRFSDRTSENPDGMAIDSEDRLWVGCWEGWCVRCYDPETGKVEAEIPVPVSKVTSCAFGGADLADLYITTAWAGESADARAQQPQAGHLFRCRPGAQGVPTVAYAG